MGNYAETDSELANTLTSFDREYIFSTGGDMGVPGVAIYREGGTLGVIVSTGPLNWVVEVAGQVPPRERWTNIAFRWRNINYVDKDEFFQRLIQGETVEDFGGLTVSIDSIVLTLNSLT